MTPDTPQEPQPDADDLNAVFMIDWPNDVIVVQRQGNELVELCRGTMKQTSTFLENRRMTKEGEN